MLTHQRQQRGVYSGRLPKGIHFSVSIKQRTPTSSNKFTQFATNILFGEPNAVRSNDENNNKLIIRILKKKTTMMTPMTPTVIVFGSNLSILVNETTNIYLSVMQK